MLDRALYIYPLDIAPHVRLAETAARIGNTKLAVRERAAVVALGTIEGRWKAISASGRTTSAAFNGASDTFKIGRAHV